MRRAITVSVIVVTFSLSGCAPSPRPSAPPAPAPTATGLGGYDDIAQACTGVTDDLITLRTVRGSVEVGLDREGAQAILEELETMRALAPLPLASAYRDVEDALKRLRSGLDASPAPTPSGVTLPSASATPTVKFSPTPTARASASAAVESAADRLSAWLRSNCDAR